MEQRNAIVRQFIYLLLQPYPNVLLLNIDATNEPYDLPFRLCFFFQLLNILVVFAEVRKKLIPALDAFKRFGD